MNDANYIWISSNNRLNNYQEIIKQEFFTQKQYKAEARFMALIPNVTNLHAIFDSNVLATRIKTEKTKNSLLTSSHCSWFQKTQISKL